MNEKDVRDFQAIYKAIAVIHGESDLKSLTPHKVRSGVKVYSVWFIGGSNRGIDLLWDGRNYTIGAWSHSGSVFNINVRCQSVNRSLLRKSAEMIGLL